MPQILLLHNMYMHEVKTNTQACMSKGDLTSGCCWNGKRSPVLLLALCLNGMAGHEVPCSDR